MGGGLGTFFLLLHLPFFCDVQFFLCFFLSIYVMLTNIVSLSLSISTKTAFLNKKSWHTGGFAMIEEVWKREQQAEHEKRKLEEMKKEIQEERKLAELQQDAIDAGHSKKSERLDWMYKGSLAEGTRLEDTKFTRAEGEEEPEELKRERELREDLPPERPECVAQYLAPNMDDPKQRVEAWNKMNNDPLLAMKQREMQARENIASNPVRREQIRREVDERKRRKKEKAREKKERKRAKKERKKEKYREKIRKEVREEERRKEGGSHSRHRRDDYCGSSSSDSDDEDSSSTSSYSQERRRKRRSKESSSRKKRRHSSPSSSRSRSRSPPPRRKSTIERDKDDRYGMSYANERAEQAAEARRNRRHEWRESEKEKERRAPKVEQKPKWDSRRNNVGHRAGKLSQKEKEKRLREMNEAAENYDSHRSSRRDRLDKDLREMNEEIYRDLDPSDKKKDAHPSFLSSERKKAYGSGRR